MKFNVNELEDKIKDLRNKKYSEEEFDTQKKSLVEFCLWLKNKFYITLKEYEEISHKISLLTYEKKEIITDNVQKKDRHIVSHTHKVIKSNHFFTKNKMIILVGTLACTFIAMFIFYAYINRVSNKPSIQISNSSKQSGKVINYRGVLTDREAKPIDYKTDVIFKLYDQESSGEALYVGQCIGEKGIQPAYNGYFSILIGLDCGMKEIPESIFNLKKDIYLGITIGTARELKPRQNISNLGFAVNADKLKGMSLGGGKSNVPFIDQTGRLLLDTISPLIQSTSGNFTIEGQTLTLQSAVGTSGSIIFNPDAGGNVLLANGNFGLGNTKPTTKLDIEGNASLSGTLNFRGQNPSINILNGNDLSISTSALDETFLSSKLVIKNNGNVGIGDFNPKNLLSASQIATESSVVAFRNLVTIDSKNNNILDLQIGVPAEGVASRFIQFFANSTFEEKGSVVGSITLNNGGVAYQTSGADFAEYFEVLEKTLEGDLIGVNSEGVKKATDGTKVVGVVSNTAGFIGNANDNFDKNNRTLVGLLGQVYAHISNEKGLVMKGDEIAVSSIPGYGAKAIHKGYVVGKALEHSQNISNDKCPEEFKKNLTVDGDLIECGKVKVLVQPSWFEPL